MNKLKKAILPIALSVSVVGLAGCSTGGTKYVSTKAGDVTEKDIIEYIGTTQVSKAATDIAMKKVLLDKYKSKIDDKAIEKAYEKDQEKYGGKEKFEATLKQQGFTPDKYKEALKTKAAQTYMIIDYAKITDDQVKELYEKNKAQSHLAHILISVKSDTFPNGLSEEDAKTKAEEIAKKAKAGDDFATLAKENSTDSATASNGGDLGWSSKEDNSFVSDFSDAAFALKKGEVSDIVKSQFGYHIIKSLDTRELSYDDMKDELQSKLVNEVVTKDPELFTKAIKQLFEEYKVKADSSDIDSYIKNMLGESTTK